MILFSMVLESKLVGGGGVLALLFAGLILVVIVLTGLFCHPGMYSCILLINVLS